MSVKGKDSSPRGKGRNMSRRSAIGSASPLFAGARRRAGSANDNSKTRRRGDEDLEVM